MMLIDPSYLEAAKERFETAVSVPPWARTATEREEHREALSAFNDTHAMAGYTPAAIRALRCEIVERHQVRFTAERALREAPLTDEACDVDEPVSLDVAHDPDLDETELALGDHDPFAGGDD